MNDAEITQQDLDKANSSIFHLTVILNKRLDGDLDDAEALAQIIMLWSHQGYL